MLSVPYSRYVIYPIPWYSFLIVIGASAAIFLASREAVRKGLSSDVIVDLALWILPAGIIGARLYYVIFSWHQFRNDLVSILRIWEGGLAIYGGIIAGFIALLFFARKKSVSPLILCDILVPGLALAQSIGRWGNYFNIEAYGPAVSNESLRFFPLAVQVPADHNTWHLATFFYESFWDLSVFILLMCFRKRFLRKKGDVFFSYLLLYGSGRLVIEELRTDSLYAASGVRVSQLISLILCLSVMIYYFFVTNKFRAYPSWIRMILLPFTVLLNIAGMVYSVFGNVFLFNSAFSVMLFLLLIAVFNIAAFLSLKIIVHIPEE